MNSSPTPIFPPGRIVIAPAALSRLSLADIRQALGRHITGDWGDLGRIDREENQTALNTGHRLLSIYHNREGIQFWIITEADRSVTNVYLPEAHHRRDLETASPVADDHSRKANQTSASKSAIANGITFRFRMRPTAA